jgi:hypothetical protein
MPNVFAALLTDQDLTYTPRSPEFLKLATDTLSNFATDSDGFDSLLNSLLTSLPPEDIVSTTLDPALAALSPPAAGLQTDNEADAAAALQALVAAGQPASDDAARAGSSPLPPTWLTNLGSNTASEAQAKTFRAVQTTPEGEFPAGQSVSQVLDQLSNTFK